ncbi:MAG: hypothetical protein HONBIEJF_02706 [Fimbriimonadaceae bacterium]|nr:hypothetical protein [Fimbriimonadaceae bacterium]
MERSARSPSDRRDTARVSPWRFVALGVVSVATAQCGGSIDEEEEFFTRTFRGRAFATVIVEGLRATAEAQITATNPKRAMDGRLFVMDLGDYTLERAALYGEQQAVLGPGGEQSVPLFVLYRRDPKAAPPTFPMAFTLSPSNLVALPEEGIVDAETFYLALASGKVDLVLELSKAGSEEITTIRGGVGGVSGGGCTKFDAEGEDPNTYTRITLEGADNQYSLRSVVRLGKLPLDHLVDSVTIQTEDGQTVITVYARVRDGAIQNGIFADRIEEQELIGRRTFDDLFEQINLGKSTYKITLIDKEGKRVPTSGPIVRLKAGVNPCQ